MYLTWNVHGTRPRSLPCTAMAVTCFRAGPRSTWTNGCEATPLTKAYSLLSLALDILIWFAVDLLIWLSLIWPSSNPNGAEQTRKTIERGILVFGSQSEEYYIKSALWLMAWRTMNITFGACLFCFMAYITRNLRSVSIKQTDRTNGNTLYKWPRVIIINTLTQKFKWTEKSTLTHEIRVSIRRGWAIFRDTI